MGAELELLTSASRANANIGIPAATENEAIAAPVTYTPGAFNLDFLIGAQPDPKDVSAANMFSDRGRWEVDDSNMASYGIARFTLSCAGMSLSEIIAEQIGHSEQNVGMDVLGGCNGVALRDLLASGVLGKAILTNLADMRSEKMRDERLHHVAGDILEPFTWQDMRQKQLELAPDGLALIMHRPAAALQYQPLPVYEGGVHALLDMMRPGGILFTQRPNRVRLARGDLHMARSLYGRGDVRRIALSDPDRYPFERGQVAALIFKK